MRLPILLLIASSTIANLPAQDGSHSASAPQKPIARQQLTGGFAGENLSGNLLPQSSKVDRLGGDSVLSPAIAATTILPAAYASKMGEGDNTFPHARENMRYQQVFLGAEVGPSQIWTQLCLRRDQANGGPAQSQQLVVTVGDTTLNHNTLTATFNSNWRTKLSPVFSGTLNLPYSSGGGTVNDFFMCIPFNRPISWGATTTINLLIEIQNTSSSASAHYDDAASAAGVTTTRVYSTSSSSATTGTVNRNYGLVMRLGNPGRYDLYGRSCLVPCTVLPAASALTMGNINNTYPHAEANMRYQQMFRGADIGPSQTWTSLSLRRDDASGGAAQTQYLTLIVGDTTLNESTLTATFDNNWRVKLPPVLSGPVNLPASTGGGVLNDFYITLPFDRPVSWGSTTTINLLLEIVNTSAGSTAHFADAVNGPGVATTRVYASGYASATGTVSRNYGLVMCLGRPRPLLYNAGVPEIGTSFSILLANAPPSAVAALWFGFAKTSIDLTPSWPGCTLLASLDIFPIGVATTGSIGTAGVVQPIPNNLSLRNAQFTNQWLVFDASAPGGLIFSNGGEGTVGN